MNYYLPDNSEIAAQGCYTDSSTDRDLPHNSQLDPELVTPAACMAYCGDKSYKYAGVQVKNHGQMSGLVIKSLQNIILNNEIIIKYLKSL